MSVPLHKLKFTKDLNDQLGNIMEVKEILDFKDENGVNLYLVKWVDNTESWEKESNFNAFECIQEFHAKQSGILPPKRKRGRPPKISTNTLMLSIMFVLFSSLLAIDVKMTVKFCNINSNQPFWDEKFDCENNKLDRYWSTNKINFTILNKRHDVIMGNGFKCSKKMYTYNFYETLTGEKIQNLVTENLRLSKEDCEDMISYKMCASNDKMTCAGLNCWFKPTIKPEYTWLSYNKVVYYECKVTPLQISAKNYNDLLFGEKCKASDLVCSTDDFTIIWKHDIIHECPFSKIKTLEFEVEKNFQ